MKNYTTEPLKNGPDLAEARRLFDLGYSLCKLVPYMKRPLGDDWNKHPITEFDEKATGYGVMLAANGLASVDPDNAPLAAKMLAGFGFDLEAILEAGVRSASTRPGSGGRSAFKDAEGLTWIPFRFAGIGTVLELRATSPNLQDVIPGLLYKDKSGEIRTQSYVNCKRLDDAPELPADLLAWWRRMSTDLDFRREQQIKAGEILGLVAQPSVSNGKVLAFKSPYRLQFNALREVPEILLDHGYEDHGGRFSAPNSEGSPGIRLIRGKESLWQSDHGSDPLQGTFDAWTAFVVLEHQGELEAAEADAAAMIEAQVCDEFESDVDRARQVRAEIDGSIEICDLLGTEALLAEVREKIPDAKLAADEYDALIARLTTATTLPADEVKAALGTQVVVPRELPNFRRDKNGRIEATVENVVVAVRRADLCGMDIRFDEFRDEIMYARPGTDQWQSFGDPDYTRLRMALERGEQGFKPIGRELIRDAVLLVAMEHRFDTAITWLESLQWDGVPRVERFLHSYFGAEDSTYVRAVSRYTWTALAGRVLRPGVKADMVPILVGAQGAGKSSAVAAMAPAPEFFAEISFNEKDEDLARKMRGRLVAEIGELRGLHTKELDAIKQFITRTHENWIPKYREFATIFPRRLVFIGTTNDAEFLADPTGHRRWLPVDVPAVDVEAVARDRLQLWAEAREMFKAGGVQFKQAEDLATEVHGRYEMKDAWLGIVQDWLDEPDALTGETPRERAFLHTHDVLKSAVRLEPKQIDRRAEMRAGSVLKTLGYVRRLSRVPGSAKPVRVWWREDAPAGAAGE